MSLLTLVKFYNTLYYNQYEIYQYYLRNNKEYYVRPFKLGRFMCNEELIKKNWKRNMGIRRSYTWRIIKQSASSPHDSTQCYNKVGTRRFAVSYSGKVRMYLNPKLLLILFLMPGLESSLKRWDMRLLKIIEICC